MNSTTIVGHIGKDPELRHTQKGNAVCNFSVACSYAKDITEWYNVSAWGINAEFAGKLSKGDRVVVVGQMKTRKWQDKNGNDRYTTELVAPDFFGVVAKAPSIKKREAGEELDDELDDEIPF